MTGNLAQELFESITRHDLERMKALLARGADPDGTDGDGWHPLHVAIGHIDEGGSAEFIRALLAYGADPNAWDLHHHETPILSATNVLDIRNLDGAAVLLAAGADPNVKRSDGESPLRMAAHWRSLPLAKMLLQHSAGKTIDEFGGDWSWTALGHAARNFDIPMIELLLAAGADPEATDDLDLTARDRLPPRESQDPTAWDHVIELLGRRRS